jgi:ribose 1,5-bisphosphokinase PhnN
MRKKLIAGSVLTLVFVLGLSLGLWAQKGLALFINGSPSHLPLKQAGKMPMVPLYLPADPDIAEWTVQIERDDSKGRVDVKLSNKKKQKRRGDNPCTACMTTGKCPYDYPSGSGNTTNGDPCYSCTATGKCNYCKGEGKW